MSVLGIVIVNYNTREDLGRCLDSIADSPGRHPYRVIVVDNGSSDGSVDMVREAYPWVELIPSAYNGGYAYANNIGLRALGFGCTDDSIVYPAYALLLNPDTILPPDTLDTMVDFMDQHPDIGVIGPRLVRRDGSLDRACRRSFPTPEVSLYHLLGLPRLFPTVSALGATI